MGDQIDHSQFSGPIVQVAVGSDAKSFYVHQNILCGASDYFAAACTERWLADDGIVKLPDDDPRIFQELLNYLHVDDSIFDDLWEIKEGDTSPHIQLYLLADKLQFKNLLSKLEFWCCGSLYGCSGDHDYEPDDDDDEDDDDGGDDDDGDLVTVPLRKHSVFL
ncbi:hypothetical protein MMC30_001399 [Trapelia coarctata]|nr:hypothetical protein [Trapelia coarctata]